MSQHSARFEEILYDGLIDLESPELRAEFLDQTCRNDPERRTRLEKLAALHDEAETFFDMVLELDSEAIESLSGETASAHDQNR